MTRSFCCLASLLVLLGFVASATAADLVPGKSEVLLAQGTTKKSATTKTAPKPPPKTAAAPINPEQPTVTIMLASMDEFLADLKWVFSLAKAEKQYATLTDTLELFLAGIDRAQPVATRGYLSGDQLAFIASLPISNEKNLGEFLANIDALDVKSKQLVKNEYELKNLVVGFLRYEPAQKYAHAGEHRAHVAALKAPDPAILKGYDLVALIDNRAQKPESRREVFVTLRKELLGGLKKTAKESDVEFELRKVAAEHQIDEMERFFVESTQILFGWTTSVKDKLASLNIELSAIPETSLAQSIALLGAKPDRFALVPRDKDAVLSGSVNFPIDDMRKAHLLQNSKLMRQYAAEKVDAQTDVKDAQKAIEREIVGSFWDIVDGLAEVGAYNGFVRVVPADKGTYTTVGGGRVADGAQVVKLIEKIGARSDVNAVKLNVDKVGDVAIHSLTVPKIAADYPELFTSDALVYVGTSADTAWFAMGTNSLDRLKAAIETAGAEGETRDTVVDLYAKLDLWIRILDRRLGKDGDKEMRQMALDSFQSGHDTLTLQLKRVEQEARVSVTFNESLIEFAGRVMAKFVKESLE